MKRIVKVLVLLSVFIIAQSCYSSHLLSLNPTLDEVFVGQTYAQIVEEMGAPDRTTPDGKGGTILIYDIYKQYVTSGRITPFSQVNANTVEENTYCHFYVNTDNICYQTKTNLTTKQKEFNLPRTMIAGAGAVFLAAMAIVAAQH